MAFYFLTLKLKIQNFKLQICKSQSCSCSGVMKITVDFSDLLQSTIKINKKSLIFQVKRKDAFEK